MGWSYALAGATGRDGSRKRSGGNIVRHLQDDDRVVISELTALFQLSSELLHRC